MFSFILHKLTPHAYLLQNKTKQKPMKINKNSQNTPIIKERIRKNRQVKKRNQILSFFLPMFTRATLKNIAV